MRPRGTASLTISTLTTERLQLRPLAADDTAFVGTFLADPDGRRYLGGPIPTDQHAAKLAQYLQSGARCVCPAPARDPIGLVFLEPTEASNTFELSYQFAQTAWGQGYATEALGAVLRHAIGTLGARRIFAETQAANAPSCRLLVRLGFAEAQRVTRFGAEQVVYETTRAPA